MTNRSQRIIDDLIADSTSANWRRSGLTVPMDKLDKAVVNHLEWRSLDPQRLTAMMDQVLEHRLRGDRERRHQRCRSIARGSDR
jgi:hypothetical protein